MPITGFNVNGQELTQNWPDKSYLIDRYPELSNILRQAGLWLWGRNNYGQLANGDILGNSQSSPVQTISSGYNWKQVAGGQVSMFAIKADGTLWGWGSNSQGILGDNSITTRSSPVQTVSSGTNWKLVSAGTYHACAIKTDGTLWLWGRNNGGQLGDNSITSKSSPVQTVSGGTNWKALSGGREMTVSIKTDGTLWLWGRNNYGNLGDNTIASKSSPIQTVSGGTNWRQISSYGGSVAAIKNDGTLWLWGNGTSGQLGDNTITNKSSPVQTISGGTNWRQVSNGTFSAGAIKTDGTLWMWGQNNFGQLGNNTRIGTSSPIQTVASGTNWKQVDGPKGLFTGAIKTDGTLWMWGQAQLNGNNGDNTMIDRSSPVQTIAGGTNWKQVSNGAGATLAIRDFNPDF